MICPYVVLGRVRTYTVGSQGIGYFPMAIFKDVGPVTVRFALASGQGGARTLVIATTSAFGGGRPIVTVNSWSSSTPPAPTEPDSRGVTRGTVDPKACTFKLAKLGVKVLGVASTSTTPTPFVSI